MRGVKGKRYEYILELPVEHRVGLDGVVSVKHTRVLQEYAVLNEADNVSCL